MSEFDQFDDQLANALRSRAGTGPGAVGTAHEAVLARAGHIRRRRAAVVGGVAMVAVLTGGVALLRGGPGGTLAPADTGVVLPSVPDDRADPTEPSTSTEQSGVATTAVPTSTGDRPTESEQVPQPGTTVLSTIPESTVPSPAPTTSPDTSVTTAGTAPAVVPSSTDQPTATTTATSEVASTTSTSDVSSTTSTSEVSPPPLAPFTRTYQSLGGSITVEWDGASLDLLDVAAAAGFEPEIEDNEALRIRVRFRGDDDDSRIEIRVNDGELIESID